MPKEYKIIKVPPGETSADNLNKAALEGWEVLHCVATVGVLCYTLVREVSEGVRPTNRKPKKLQPEPLSPSVDLSPSPVALPRPEGLRRPPEGKISTEDEVDQILEGLHKNQESVDDVIRISPRTGKPVRKYTKTPKK